MADVAGNLYDGAVAPAAGERVDTLLARGGLRIERIVSAAATPPAAYLQAGDEWVLLVRGTALLHIDGRPVPLRAGDHLFLPAGTPHTVAEVSEGALWLALHLPPGAPP